MATSKKDLDLINRLNNMVERLTNRLEATQQELILARRQLEIMQERHNYSDDDIDIVRQLALED